MSRLARQPKEQPESVPDVLIVENDPHVAEMLAEYLRDEGFRVRSRADGAAALETIELAPPDVVLADMMMPRMTGLALAKEIRRRWRRINVILMSASELPTAPEIPFIEKPFDLEMVSDLITRHNR